jgi:hypothetical protein
MARAHLAKWVAAATVVQRSARDWLFRQRLRALVLQHRQAAEALQAAWRGRQVRQELRQLEASAILVQVSEPGVAEGGRCAGFEDAHTPRRPGSASSCWSR